MSESLLLKTVTKQKDSKPKEGDLFKVIQLCGEIFEIIYGFYEECDRYTSTAEPIPIYPNFIETPRYTNEGFPFVTEMQIPCKYFEGIQDENSACGDCSLYIHGDELLGICNCSKNKKSQIDTFTYKNQSKLFNKNRNT